MATRWKKAFPTRFSEQKRETTGGFLYIAYQHPNGQVVISRATTDGAEIMYADGEFDLETAWTGKAGLAYAQLTNI